MTATILPFRRLRLVPPPLPALGTWGELRDEHGQGGVGWVHAVDPATDSIVLREPCGALICGAARDFTAEGDAA